jgi:hypothetical protein
MVHELVDPDLPPNRQVLDHLRESASRATVGDPFAAGEWQLHTHPDLVDRMAELAEGHPVVLTYGVAVVPANGIIAITALGMYGLMVRIPVPPDLRPTDSVSTPLAGWHAVRAFPATNAEPRLRQLVAAAIRHAGRGHRDGPDPSTGPPPGHHAPP